MSTALVRIEDTFEEQVLRGLGAYAPIDEQREQRGHRWRWLIKSIGYENFQKVAALPPDTRRDVINQLAQKLKTALPSDMSEKDVAEIVCQASQTG